MLRTNWVSGVAATIAVLLVSATAAIARPLSVEVWTDRGDDAVYTAGDAMQVKVRANDDAYLLVYEINSDGQVTVLFPFRRASGMVEGRSTLRLPPEDSRYELTVESDTGLGYIVALASRRPFRELPWYLRPFDPQGESVGYEGRHDDTDGFDDDGRVLGDPTVAIERIRRAVLGDPGDLDDFATSYTTYYVGHEVRYPRYLCNDCHRPGSWSWWDGFDPYYASCSVFDFRVNWNWCWGPCMWSSHVPYYYYVVRSDCPPRYRGWYDRHDRWSSWDGSRTWSNLWGGPLVRHKSAPPVGYIPPPVKGSDAPRGLPPGFIKSAGGPGGRGSVPIGRNRPDVGQGDRPGGQVWRTPPGAGGTPGVKAPDRAGTREQPRFRPPRPTTPDRDDKGYQPRQDQPRREPARYDPPRQDQPRREPERYDPPRQDQPRREQPRHDPPRQDQPRHEQPRYDPPRQDSPRQERPEQPRREPGGSSGGGKHKGGGR
ncbi:MAG: DUF4384 domain-containing protein [Candidatus Eisenbacteria bacterium]|nr:DUF4384 domain-containing protein [Candidatus Eisenbacteria bacterium]